MVPLQLSEEKDNSLRGAVCSEKSTGRLNFFVERLLLGGEEEQRKWRGELETEPLLPCS